MSKLLKETENYLDIEEYLRSNNEEYSSWMIDSEGREKYPTNLLEIASYALYETKVIYRLYKKSGEIVYLSLNGIPLIDPYQTKRENG